MPRKDKKKEKFANSASKAIMRGDVLRKNITRQTDPKDAYEMHDEHDKWVFKAWKDALTRMINAVEQDRGRMQRDVTSYGHDLKLVQDRRTEVAEKAFHRSPAYRQLKEDVDNGLHEIFPPKDLWLKREAYQAFDLLCFRKHIYQEVDSRPKRALRFARKKKRYRYPELHTNHPRELNQANNDT